ncbi:hypothetical protein DP68_13460 [Clostridium sp. HMP27]|nr:hypothetical protein DP68_13460 [Clostridium sp. HMP27]
MIDKFLRNLQEDVFDEKGYYFLYFIIFCVSFVITIEQYKLLCEVIRLILSATALLFLTLIYLRCKDSRSEKQRESIFHYIVFFIVLTLACIYNIKKLN